MQDESHHPRLAGHSDRAAGHGQGRWGVAGMKMRVDGIAAPAFRLFRPSRHDPYPAQDQNFRHIMLLVERFRLGLRVISPPLHRLKDNASISHNGQQVNGIDVVCKRRADN